MADFSKVQTVWLNRADSDDEAAIASLANSAGVSQLMARLLIHRGIESPQQANEFLTPRLANLPSPFLMKDMEAAAVRIADAVARKEKIVVYGDYDVDGITSTSLLVGFLRRLGAECEYYIPSRMDEGYGLNAEAIESLASSGADVVVSVDTGTTALEEARLAKKLGLCLIVVDHHQIGAELPEACALINPQRPDCDYPYKHLAAVGVVFNLLIAIRSKLHERGVIDKGKFDLRKDLDLVALGTVADIVPLHGVNRILVAYGLERISRAVRPGLIVLKEVGRINTRVDSYHVGFIMGPRLNAGGRMEHAAQGVELFLTSDLTRARQIATHLDELNRQRQQQEQRMFEQAVAMMESSDELKNLPVVVLASKEWHPGIVGIVASRITERYQRPTILVSIDSNGIGKGSGRSVPGVDIYKTLVQASKHLIKFGGHEQAAGITIEHGNLEAFRDAFAQAVLDLYPHFMPIRTIKVDMDLAPSQIDSETMKQMDRLSPFGMGNPQPVFMMRNAKILRTETPGGRILKLYLSHGGRTFQALGFRLSQLADVLTPGKVVNVAYRPKYNTFRGLSEFVLHISDIQLAGEN